MKTETPQALIARACYWRVWQGRDCLMGVPPDGHVRAFDCPITGVEVPDYSNDLNAMHEAEKALTSLERFNYSAELERIVYDALGDTKSAWCYSSATAPQRAEAFLKIISQREPITS